VIDAIIEAKRILTLSRSLSQRANTYSRRITAEETSLTEEVSSLQRAVDIATTEATQRFQESPEWVTVLKQLENAQSVLHGNGPGGDLRKYTKVKKPWLLDLLIGPSSNVVSIRKDESLKLKEDYHHFRNRSAYIMFCFSATVHLGIAWAKARAEANEAFTLTPVILVGIQMFLCWLLYFYTATALRESVLKCNGSLIKPWWIHHHYWSIGTCILMLSLPVDSPSFVKANRMFLNWACLQAVVIILQNRYQRRRMYTRIALGKNSAMDVVAGESSGGSQGLLLLYPMLFAMQGLQAMVGVEMMMHTYPAMLSAEGFLELEERGSDLWGSRGVFVVGVMMLYMGSMNFLFTVMTIMQKKVARKKEQKRVTVMQNVTASQNDLVALGRVSATGAAAKKAM
jgi:hypothetical protein